MGLMNWLVQSLNVALPAINQHYSSHAVSNKGVVVEILGCTACEAVVLKCAGRKRDNNLTFTVTVKLKSGDRNRV